MVREVVMQYSGPGRSPKLSVFHFDDASTNLNITAALRALFTTWASWADASYSVVFPPTLRRYNTATGVLEGEVPMEGTLTPIPGTVSGQPLPDAVSMLWRWTTGQVVSGRFLRGRTYAPGIAATYLAGGNMAGSTVNSLTTAATTYAGSSADPQIWSRTHGVMHPITGGTCWNEFATQRRRRA